MKVGIALSGGGARGIAHLGVLQALEDHGIEVTHISGASAGSIGAAFYAHGYSPKAILRIMDNTNLLKLAWPAFSTRGLLSISKSERVYKKYFPKDSFEDANIPLYVATTNLNTGMPEIFTSNSLSQAIMASCSIPFIFDPVKIGAHHYVDGGILNNLPTEPLIEVCDFVIGSNVSPVVPEEELGGPKSMIERVSMLTLSSNVLSSSKLCDLYLKPNELRKFGTFDFKKSAELFKIGYEYTQHMLEVSESPKLRELVG